MTLQRLWAGWRASYIDGVVARDQEPDDACLFCTLPDLQEDGGLLAVDDSVFAVLNAYPYTSGHVMVAPRRHVAELEELIDTEAAALMAMLQTATRAVKAAFGPDGINVGMNIGRAAGAGIPGHLHVHVVPRWLGDTNFMTSVAEARVLPEPMDVSAQKLRKVWVS